MYFIPHYKRLLETFICVFITSSVGYVFGCVRLFVCVCDNPNVLNRSF